MIKITDCSENLKKRFKKIFCDYLNITVSNETAARTTYDIELEDEFYTYSILYHPDAVSITRFPMGADVDEGDIVSICIIDNEYWKIEIM